MTIFKTMMITLNACFNKAFFGESIKNIFRNNFQDDRLIVLIIRPNAYKNNLFAAAISERRPFLTHGCAKWCA